ncbi:response regulator transcription factor [Dehalogenimonas sp. THU2]|uniref:response regulator n=1 Tax=Dehalogenimonas sp. THU2 TaxID=3151121 RepID=UPI003218550A
MTLGKTSIILADDHAIVRRGVRALLEYEPDFHIVAEATDGVEALSLIERLKPDVVVTDLCMPAMSGIELMRALKSRGSEVRTIVLTMCGDGPYVASALEAGAFGYILKEAGVEHLVSAIREARAGRRYFSPPISDGTPFTSG